MSHEDTPLFLQPGEADPYFYSDIYAPRVDLRGNSLRSMLISGHHCATNGCDGATGYMGLPFCEDCAWKMWAEMDSRAPEYMKEASRKGLLDHERKRRAAQVTEEINARVRRRNAPSLGLQNPGWIYYLRIGDLIKIGYTANMEQRMRAYPPNTRVLAKHPGTMQLEKEIHNSLIVNRAKGREWFKPSEEVMAHIENVKVKFPERSAWHRNQERMRKNREQMKPMPKRRAS